MRHFVFAVFLVTLHGQSAAVQADLALRLRTAYEQIPRAASRTQAEQSVNPLRSKLKQAIGIHRVSQVVRATLFSPSPAGHSYPLLLLLVPECTSQAPAYAQRGFLTVCVNQTQEPDLLAGITPQGRIQHDIARVLAMPGFDRNRMAVAGHGTTAVIAAALFPEFTQIAVEAPRIDSELIHGIANFADTLELLAVAAPRPMLVNNASTALTDSLRDRYRFYEAGDKLFLDSSPLQWLAPNVQPGPTLAPENIELPAESTIPDLKSSIQQISGIPLPAARMTMALRVALSQEITFETQPGIHIPATVLRAGPAGGNHSNGTLIAISDQGRTGLIEDEIIKEAHRKNWDVVAVDPRGLGDMKLTDEAASQIASFQLGEYFPSRQATDVARIIDFIARPMVNKRSAIYARGPKSTLIAAFAAATTDAEWILLRDAAISFEIDPPFNPNFDLQTLLHNPKFAGETRFE